MIRANARGNESVDKTLRRMLRDVTPEMDNYKLPNTGPRTNISISEDTYTKLNRRKLYPREPITQVIKRCLLVYQEKHRDDVE